MHNLRSSDVIGPEIRNNSSLHLPLELIRFISYFCHSLTSLDLSVNRWFNDSCLSSLLAAAHVNVPSYHLNLCSLNLFSTGVKSHD
jgi:hypothetical protein